MKTLFSFLIVVTCSFSMAQNDFKPLDSLSSWQGRSVFVTGGAGWVGWQHYYTDSIYNDTLIGGEFYTKMFFESSPNSGEYFCGFRSDTIEKAIYVLPKDSISEYLFFDFDSTLIVDDVFETTFFNGEWWETESYTITDIDSIIMDGEYYTKWDFGFFEITERIMNSNGLPFHGGTVEVLGYYGLELRCYYEANQSVYGTDCPYSYELALMSGEITENDLDVEIFPNPFNELIQINNERGKEVVIYNYLGELIVMEDITTEKYTLNTSIFKNGVYLIKVGNKTTRLIKL